jgi:hypothetical protein
VKPFGTARARAQAALIVFGWEEVVPAMSVMMYAAQKMAVDMYDSLMDKVVRGCLRVRIDYMVGVAKGLISGELY